MVTVVALLAAVLLLGGAIAVPVFVGTRIRDGLPLFVSFRPVLGAYFYVMSIVSLVILAIGLTGLLKAGFSDWFGRGFSYSMPALPSAVVKPAPPTPGQPPSAQPSESAEFRRRQLELSVQQYRGDLVQGGTLATAGAVVWALHTWSRRRLIRSTDAWVTFLSRAHLAVLLLLFGVAGLISLVMGVYQVLLFAVMPAEESLPPQPPGEAAAMAIVFVALWLATLALALREARSSEGR